MIAPLIKSQMALFVGEPVKNRETSELNESEAFTPKIISRIPPARSARAIILFMFSFSIMPDVELERDGSDIVHRTGGQ